MDKQEAKQRLKLKQVILKNLPKWGKMVGQKSVSSHS